MTETDFDQQNTEPFQSVDQAKASDTEAFSFLEGVKQVGPYKIESLLQRSGMSLLYLATDSTTKLPAAVKVLLPKLTTHKDVVEHFLREAKILALADHPNIVKMYAHGSWEGGYYIGMEFIIGGSLRQYILNHPLSLKRGLEMILDIAYAICHLHTHGIIHRDLKLENILITEQGEIKLIDFGIAQLLDGVKTEERSVFQYRTIGTPIYMSPEQRANPNSVSYPSDIYSLGIIAYELVLGRLSHGHVHLSLMPKGLQKILAKALQPDPQQRYQDIVDFIADLSAYLGSTTLDQERKVGDRTSELYDSLQQAKKNLLPQKAPAWPLLEIGLDTNLTTFDGAIYGDFIKLNEDSYKIFFGTSLGIDAEGLLSDAAMKSRIRAVCLQEEMSLKDLADLLNRILLEDPYEVAFALCGLAISPLKGHLHFISCGYGVLWHIPKETGIPYQVHNDNGYLKGNARLFHETFCPMKAGDQFLLYGENHRVPETEALLFQGIVEYSDLSPQLKAEGISRKLKIFSAKEPSHQFVIAILKLCDIN